MRSELVLILWVIAGLSAVAAIYGGSVPANFVASSGQDEVSDPVLFSNPEQPAESGVDAPQPDAELLSIAIEPRLLFAVQVAASAAAATEAAPVVAEFGFVLRGIVRRDDSWRAIFEGGDGQSQYSVIGLGESLSGFEVVALEADRVVLRSARDGTEQTHILRGDGEAR